MKKTFIIFGVALLSSTGFAAQSLKIEKVKSIICSSTFYYDEETPNVKTPSEGTDFKIFTAGSREDLEPKPGAFTLAEYSLDEKNNLSERSNQQFYFSEDKSGKIIFEFLAAWKASGELSLDSDGSAKGFINQKSHVTELSCILKR